LIDSKIEASGQPPAAFIATDAYRVLKRLGFDVDADTPLPSPDANFEDFNKGLADFLPAVQDGFESIVNLAMEINIKTPTPQAVIAMLTGSLAEDLHDVLVLCSSERRSGALRLLRTPYEKFLYASHISRHPAAAEDFMMFDAIQAKTLLDGIEKISRLQNQPSGQAGLEAMYKIARGSFQENQV
jgi:hypothetical protein